MKDNAYKEEVLKLIEGEESAFKAGTNFAKEMDRCAQVNEIKNSEIFRKIGEDPLGGANNRILKGTSSSSTETKYKESCAMTKQLTKEDVARVDKNTVPNYTSILESLNLPITSFTSFSTKQIFIESSPEESSSKSSTDDSLSKIRYMLPKVIRNDGTQTEDPLHREALQFMRGIMDECTHLKNYDVPKDTSLVYIVAAENDAYFPREGVVALSDIWPGSHVRYIEGEGHIASYFFRKEVFRKAIYDCIDNYVHKYKQTS